MCTERRKKKVISLNSFKRAQGSTRIINVEKYLNRNKKKVNKTFVRRIPCMSPLSEWQELPPCGAVRSKSVNV